MEANRGPDWRSEPGAGDATGPMPGLAAPSEAPEREDAATASFNRGMFTGSVAGAVVGAVIGVILGMMVAVRDVETDRAAGTAPLPGERIFGTGEREFDSTRRGVFDPAAPAPPGTRPSAPIDTQTPERIPGRPVERPAEDEPR